MSTYVAEFVHVCILQNTYLYNIEKSTDLLKSFDININFI